MTKLLEEAFEEASKLPDEDQDALAEMLLADLHSEIRCDKAFAGSQQQLASLATQALGEFDQGKTKLIEEGSDFSHD